MSSSSPLSPEHEAEVQRLTDRILQVSRAEVEAIARLLLSKPDNQLLGQTEFEVRDRVHRIGAQALETALDERKKRGTMAPV